MHTFQEETGYATNRKDAQSLYSKYMTLAFEMRTKGDRVLFEDYYQRAEYYLCLMNELNKDLPIMPVKMAGPPKKDNPLPSPSSHVLRGNRGGGYGK